MPQLAQEKSTSTLAMTAKRALSGVALTLALLGGAEVHNSNSAEAQTESEYAPECRYGEEAIWVIDSNNDGQPGPEAKEFYCKALPGCSALSFLPGFITSRLHQLGEITQDQWGLTGYFYINVCPGDPIPAPEDYQHFLDANPWLVDVMDSNTWIGPEIRSYVENNPWVADFPWAVMYQNTIPTEEETIADEPETTTEAETEDEPEPTTVPEEEVDQSRDDSEQQPNQDETTKPETEDTETPAADSTTQPEEEIIADEPETTTEAETEDEPEPTTVPEEEVDQSRDDSEQQPNQDETTKPETEDTETPAADSTTQPEEEIIADEPETTTEAETEDEPEPTTVPEEEVDQSRDDSEQQPNQDETTKPETEDTETPAADSTTQPEEETIADEPETTTEAETDSRVLVVGATILALVLGSSTWVVARKKSNKRRNRTT